MASGQTLISRQVHSGAARPTTGRAVNVRDEERVASVLGGGLLTAIGLSRGSLGGLGLAALGGALLYRGATGHCHLYGAMGVSTADDRGPVTAVPAGKGVRIERSVTVNRPAEELFRFWRNLENLPRVMKHLKSVTVTGNRSHWVARGPMGASVEWDAEVINERPNELIAWRSLEGSEVDTAGSVHFAPAPGGRGTVARVNLKYDPPAGKLGAVVAKLFQEEPGAQIREDLRRFKALMECGEVPSVEGQSTCRR
jgi:uncharacterized membrane protein